MHRPDEATQEPWRGPTAWRVVRSEPRWGGQRLRDLPDADAPRWRGRPAATVATSTYLWGRVENAGHLG
eukprot:13679808-Alexandrium_andersonii.AAC.1